ncbi:hypothetical protein CLAIMM_15005 [Cladophialophora immunda]|nr:hypothetical protein CLAIMM_15005 [Cladophialophora immunda]
MMPKASAWKSKGPAGARRSSTKRQLRTPRKKADSIAAKGKESKNPPGFRLLDLPPEIRLQIYRYFATVGKIILPKEPALYRRKVNELEKRKRGVRDAKATRTSLQWVCHQISEEWAPIFFSTTTIVVNPARSPDDGSQLPDDGLEDFQYTPEEFRNFFMDTTPECKLKYITKLKYIDFLGKDLTNPKTGLGLASLIGALKEHLPKLPSLSKVTYLVVLDSDCRPLTPYSYRATHETAFSFPDYEGRLRTLEQQALSGTGTGFLNNWVSQRKIKYRLVLGLEREDRRDMKLIFRREQLPTARSMADRMERGHQQKLEE